MSYSVFPEAYIAAMLGFVFFLMASGSGKGKRKKGFRALCSFLFVAYMAMLIWMALIARAQNNTRELILEPLRSIKAVLSIYNTFDMFKQIADNIIVFIPVGMLLPAAAGREPSSKSFWFTCGAGLFISLGIETFQYAFSLGYTEVDDLLFNTLGCMVGAGVFALSGKADFKNGSLTLKKGWLAYLMPAILVSAAMFALWVYREYYLYKH